MWQCQFYQRLNYINSSCCFVLQFTEVEAGTIQDKQEAQLSQRDHAAGYISFGRKWKTGTGGPIQ